MGLSTNRFLDLKKYSASYAKRAMDKGVRLAFENCDMDGDWKRGDWNIAHNPDRMGNDVRCRTHDNLGLEWEPAHQMVSLIDPIPQLRKWVDKYFMSTGRMPLLHGIL